MERSSGSLLAVLKQKKIPGNICFSEQIFHRKQSLDAPEQTNKQTNTSDCQPPPNDLKWIQFIMKFWSLIKNQ